MGCCVIAALLVGAPRLGLLVWWLIDSARVIGTFEGWVSPAPAVTFPTWVWPLAGFLFLPWTTVAYVFVAPGGLSTIKWVILAVALLLDLGSHGGGWQANRRRRSR